jgi:hypothetical protein
MNWFVWDFYMVLSRKLWRCLRGVSSHTSFLNVPPSNPCLSISYFAREFSWFFSEPGIVLQVRPRSHASTPRTKNYLLTLSWPAGHIFSTYKESFQVRWGNSIPLFLHAAIYLEIYIFRRTSQNEFSRETAVYKWYCVQCCVAALHTVSFVIISWKSIQPETSCFLRIRRQTDRQTEGRTDVYVHIYICVWCVCVCVYVWRI